MLAISRIFTEFEQVRGHQVAPAELEGHILEHPCVADTAVIGVESEYSGELPFAFVVLKDKAAQSCRENAKFAGIIKADIQRVSKRMLCLSAYKSKRILACHEIYVQV